jgi:hypothetical protein
VTKSLTKKQIDCLIAIHRAGGNRNAAARKLKIDRGSLRDRLVSAGLHGKGLKRERPPWREYASQFIDWDSMTDGDRLVKFRAMLTKLGYQPASDSICDLVAAFLTFELHHWKRTKARGRKK